MRFSFEVITDPVNQLFSVEILSIFKMYLMVNIR